MKTRILHFCFRLFLFSLISTSHLYSQNWPQFRGINRDSKVTGFKVPEFWPADLSQQWKVTVGTGDATPVLVGSKIYLHTRQGNDEVVLCLDASSGKELWKDSYPASPVTGAAGSHPGPRSTPVVSAGKIVTFGVSGILSCLDASTGKIIWRIENPINAVPQFFSGMSPLVADNICIAHTGTKDNGQVIAIDIMTGKEKWKWKGDGPAYASPSIMKVDRKKHVIVQTEKNLIALNLTDGKLLWQIATPPQQRFYNSASPYINGQVIYYTGQGTGTKAIKVTYQGKKFTTEELWVNTETGGKWNTPILINGFLYGYSDQKRIYCLDSSNGKKVWGDETLNSDFATIVDCGSVIIGLPSTGKLIVFKPDSKAYSEVAIYKVSETPVYAFPVIAGNLIYIKDAESLTLFKIN